MDTSHLIIGACIVIAGKLDNINYTYYIHKAEKLINRIRTGGKRIKTRVSPNQLNLFG